MVDFCEGGNDEFDITISLTELETSDFYSLRNVSPYTRNVAEEITLCVLTCARNPRPNVSTALSMD